MFMRRAIVTLVAVGVVGVVVPASAQQSGQQPATPATKLQSQGAAPAAAAAVELPTDSKARLRGEAGGPGPTGAMAGNTGLVDSKGGKSVAKGQAQ
jgi:hypothetical protein